MIFRVRKIRGKDEYKIFNVLTKKIVSTHTSKYEAEIKAINMEKEEENRRLIEKLLIVFDDEINDEIIESK
jgi:hypothetical protein